MKFFYAIAKEKHGNKQIIRNESAAFELACRYASTMQADGLVNIYYKMGKFSTDELFGIAERNNPNIVDIIIHNKDPDSKSVIIFLEDSVKLEDIVFAKDNLLKCILDIRDHLNQTSDE